MLIGNWINNPDTFNFLCDRSINDPFDRNNDQRTIPNTNPRQVSLEGLLENFRDHPKTLEILNRVALNDSDEKLRKFAVEKLKERETG